MNKPTFTACIFVVASLTTSFASFAANIPLASVKSDVSTLASDDMQGRASFTPGAEKAANYIAKRFKEIELTPLKDSFKQTFDVYVRQVTSSSITLNNKAVPMEDIAVISNSPELQWQKSDFTHVSNIDAKSDLRSSLSKLNQQGGNHLVLVDPSHEKLFKRYQAYFAHPKTKLDDTDGGSLVLVLTPVKQPEHFTVSVKTKIETKKLTNIVGVLPGKAKDDESVIYSAHYDHLGVKKHPKKGEKDIIFNGADDDASGVTGVINLAQYFKTQANNQRRLIFVAFAAEELGGFGSQFFSTSLDADKIVAMINMEMIGKPSKFGKGKVWMTGFKRSDLATIMNNALKHEHKEIYADPYPKQRLFYRSDNATLARLGVPAHSFSSTQIDKDPHYHNVSDELKTLDLRSMQKVIETIADASSPLVSGKATPTRIDPSKVNQSGKIF
ncbi:M28 family peptidase [Shewanella sp. 202IG2-18]|uniref:M28 family metallopeptidase n=1 Tax=Parashewanella hymeniacidonis TaxID=2807618 RepID=UPI001960E7BE|nr:M28 family peptidase [Parashewanella hymeniacidonis]MBM7073278.1 M28 family peptidase [Parashewanella hymeniacidonis]